MTCKPVALGQGLSQGGQLYPLRPPGQGLSSSPAHPPPALALRRHVTLVSVADSGFGRSRLVEDELVDSFVPFLPLEARHVRLCARDALLSQGLPCTDEALDGIARMMVYVPKEEPLFSSQGCKAVSQRINYFLP